MKFVRRFDTTDKVPIAESLRRELEKSHLYGTLRKIEENSTPLSLVLNLDQTPSQYVPVFNKTLAPKGSKIVPIKGPTGKIIITVTFAITLDGRFLPTQLIHGDKTKKNRPRLKLPSSFSFNVNPKFYINEEEDVKVLTEIIIPYVTKERERLGLKKDQFTLLILDVFKGQISSPVLKDLSDNSIFLQSVPAKEVSVDLLND